MPDFKLCFLTLFSGCFQWKRNYYVVVFPQGVERVELFLLIPQFASLTPQKLGISFSSGPIGIQHH
jgi:hypothetical protein